MQSDALLHQTTEKDSIIGVRATRKRLVYGIFLIQMPRINHNTSGRPIQLEVLKNI